MCVIELLEYWNGDANVLSFVAQYSGWTSQAKALYLGVRVTFVFQSRYDTVVQMLGFKPQGEGEEDEDEEEAADTPKEDNNKQ